MRETAARITQRKLVRFEWTCRRISCSFAVILVRVSNLVPHSDQIVVGLSTAKPVDIGYDMTVLS
jgi:hypothetical protein